MKKILYSLSLLGLLLVTSCTQELQIDESTQELEPGTITLTLQSVDAQTKATQAGVAAYNENLIKSVHYFFYPKDGTDTNTEKEPAKRGQATNLNKQDQHTITVNASEDEIKNVLFKYPYNDCDVYVIVNLPEDINIDNLPDHKLSTLKQIVLDANFEANLIQPSFVMEGLNVATVEDRNKVLAAKGTIPVDRVAAKITVSIEVDDRIDLQTPPDTPDNLTSGMIWTSEPKQMTIEFVNGVNRTVLSGNPDNLTLTPDDMYNVIHSVPTIPEGEPDPESWTCEPFYTYPTKWEIGSDEEPYLFITLPWTTVIWTAVDGQQPPIYKTYPCYYKIMLGSNELKRNTWYDLKINIGILGSFENTPEVILPIEEIDYFVADWSAGKDITSEILGGRYIVVDKETYTIYNENTLQIPFTSSHECEIVDASVSHVANRGTITRPDYTTDIPNLNATVAWDSKWSLIIKDNVVHFEHVLNNDISNPPYDYAPYTIKFRIRHKDNGDVYYKDITIIQYPAMMIENDQNTDYSDDNNNSNDAGFVYINANGTMYGSISGLSGSNANPNMYIITTTVLDAGSRNILGDPRKTVVDNLNNNNWGSNPALYDGTRNRKLLYYYPTDDGTENVLAPKFRIASSYGKTSTLSFANAERRCASYQEDGYPAGRWRVPTKAELFFIITLTSDGLIPVLFNNGGNYWAADGTVYSPNYNNDSVSEVNATSAYVRCVYDDWYWENSKYARLDDIETFTWGDMPRESFQ